MNCSTGSFGSWEHLLNLVHSLITFFLTLQKLSNFAKTLSYFFLSSCPILVDVKICSASSLRQYNIGALQILAIAQMQDGTTENNVSTLANGPGC